MVNKLIANLSKNQRDFLHYIANEDLKINDYSFYVQGDLLKRYKVIQSDGSSDKIEHLETDRLINKGFMKIVKSEYGSYYTIHTWKLTDYFLNKFKTKK